MQKTPTLLGIVTAFEQEAGLVRHHLRRQRCTVTPAGRVWQGELHGWDVVLIRCGMGPERSAHATAWLVQNYPINGLLSVGFAGGLQAHVATGDALLVPQLLTDFHHGVVRPDLRWTRMAAMAASHVALVQHWGTLLSVAEMLPHAVTKKQVGQQVGALAVDMESYSVGRVAAEHHLPFVVLRTVFDGCDDEVQIQSERFTTADGAIQPLRFLTYVTSHPSALTQVLPLWRKAHLAGNHLAVWLRQFLTLLYRDL